MFIQFPWIVSVIFLFILLIVNLIHNIGVGREYGKFLRFYLNTEVIQHTFALKTLNSQKILTSETVYFFNGVEDGVYSFYKTRKFMIKLKVDKTLLYNRLPDFFSTLESDDKVSLKIVNSLIYEEDYTNLINLTKLVIEIKKYPKN